MRPKPSAGENLSIAYLRELYSALRGAGYEKYLRFDLGLVHQIDYYTGVVFRGYVEGAGDAVPLPADGMTVWWVPLDAVHRPPASPST